MKKVLTLLWKSLAAAVLFAFAASFALSVSPIYRFGEPSPFEGPDIFNPYAGLDTAIGWKRANFHTHTRVKGLFNECEYRADEVYARFADFGYDIVTFSNHNELTENPVSPSLQVNVYEHGLNLFKYHKLVFGCDGVLYFDHLFPFLASQRQWIIDMLGKNADFIQLNHPARTNFTTRHIMECLTGYRITELDSGRTTEQEYWDWALSAGHYTFGLANDDLHYPDRSDRFAVRCNWLNAESASYHDIRKTLLSGAYYSMRVPDFGDGDWTVKKEMNARLPEVTEIGVRSDTVYMSLSRKAELVKAYGQNHTVLDTLADADNYVYVLGADEPYVRLSARFEDGTVIYTNPFARYDNSIARDPYRETEHTVNWFLTILFNIFALGLAALCIRLMARLF